MINSASACNYLKFLVLFFILSFNTYAALPKNLSDFSSEQNFTLAKDNLNVNLIKLLSLFETQKTTTYCGIASAVMVLNASGIKRPPDLAHKPYHFFTQDNFFTNQVRKIITPNAVTQRGVTLTQLNSSLKTYGLNTHVYFANKMTQDIFRKTLREALKRDKYIIVNFLRSKLQQQGSGHFAPIGAYDAKSDRFLILDPARYRFAPFWVSTKELWQATYTMDGKTSRGFIVINPVH